MSKFKLALSCFMLAFPLVSASVLTGCATVTDQPTIGSNQCGGEDNNEITHLIMGRLQADNQLANLPIVVSTCHNIVSLTGHVYSNYQLHKVLDIARSTEEVALVKNGLLVYGPFVNH